MAHSSPFVGRDADNPGNGQKLLRGGSLVRHLDEEEGGKSCSETAALGVLLNPYANWKPVSCQKLLLESAGSRTQRWNATQLSGSPPPPTQKKNALRGNPRNISLTQSFLRRTSYKSRRCWRRDRADKNNPRVNRVVRIFFGL